MLPGGDSRGEMFTNSFVKWLSVYDHFSLYRLSLLLGSFIVFSYLDSFYYSMVLGKIQAKK
ncbi:hypothetical protein LM701377_140087 [Listeria monocytogenes]|nr:hypothetical protein LM701377_140087 [Listeria monocytogenes]